MTAIAFLVLAATTARADICVLTKDLYTTHFSSTPVTGNNACKKADLADGTEDQKIKANLYTGADIELYVVFTQDSATPAKIGGGFTAVFSGDAKMLTPSTCECVGSGVCTLSDSSTCATGTCCDQSPVFTNNNTDFGADFGEFFPNYISKTGATYNIQFSRGGLGSTAAANNYLLMTIKIPASKNTYALGDTVTSAVFTTDTDVLDTDYNSMVAGGASKMQQTDFTVAQIPCQTKPPVAGAITCGMETSGACSPTAGPFKATMVFTAPTGCTKEGADYTCTGLSTSIDGTAVAASPYVKTGITTATPAAFSLVGKSAECQDSAAVTSAAPNCACAPPPTVTQVTVITGQTYFQDTAIELTFTLAFDSTVNLSGSGATFYYTAPSATTYTAIPVPLTSALCPSNTCTVKVSIPGTAVKERTAIKYGLKVTDSNGSVTYSPAAFRETSLTSAAEITGTQILSASSFSFKKGSEPHPSQYPFHSVGSSIPLEIIFELVPPEAEVTARIYSLDGALVRHLDYSNESLGGCSNGTGPCNICNSTQGCSWDGTNYLGGSNYVANGLYIINIHAVSNHNKFAGSVIDYTKGISVLKY